MTGVEILSSETIYNTQIWVAIVGVLASAGVIAFTVLFAHSQSGISSLTNGICLLICSVTVITLALVDNNTNYLKECSHIEYKVTIDDSVSMNEFLDKYEILDQEARFIQ